LASAGEVPAPQRLGCPDRVSTAARFELKPVLSVPHGTCDWV